jgi:Lambda phage tail tube protein, TTP
MATLGRKTTIKINNQLVGKLTSIGEVEQTAGKVDVTTLDDDHRRYIPGLKDTSDIPIEGQYVKGETGQVAMKEAYKNQTIDDYVVTFPSGATWTFKGFITSLVSAGSAEVDDTVLSFSATIAVDGEPVFAEAPAI